MLESDGSIPLSHFHLSFCQIHDQNRCPAELEAVHVPSYANDCDREPSACKLESCGNAAPCRRRAKSQVIITLSSPLPAGVWIAKSVARTEAMKTVQSSPLFSHPTHWAGEGSTRTHTHTHTHMQTHMHTHTHTKNL